MDVDADFLAGLLILGLPAAALAQARGQVLSLGFNNHYRPDCWVPMLIQLTSQSADSQDFQIQVVQKDIDRDRVVYTQMVTLGGNVEGRPATTENFWVYFKPTPVDQGLPDATNMAQNLQTLNDELKVFLCDKDGKQICTLPMTATILNVDPTRSIGDSARSTKLILFVTDGADKPEISDYTMQKGVLQDVDAVVVAPRDLPSKVIGYEAVDDIVWLDADANFLVSGTRTPSLEALLQWVKQGGDLVVCQPAEAVKLKPFEQILPVGGQINGEWTIPTVDRDDMDVLTRIAHPVSNRFVPDWPKNLGTFKVGRVPALQGSKVDEWMEWTDAGVKSFTPWLARRGYGLGAVTWVAQDLGNAALTEKAKGGWRYVWDRVFDWNNPSDVAEDATQMGGFDPFPAADGALDLGSQVIRNGLDESSTAAAYLAIAGFFFAIYWGVAGPGLYLVLVLKKKAHLSWTLFGATAVAATLLTGLLVKIVLRGPPKLQHVSIVQYALGEEDGIIHSRFGLYIPQDGLKEIALPETDPHQISYLTPFSLHPQYVSSTELPSFSTYDISVPDTSDPTEVSAQIPYRSTSKKLEAQWVGDVKASIVPAADTQMVKVYPGDKIEGTLINHTGVDLWHVYFGFKQPSYDQVDADNHDVDRIIYVQFWPKEYALKLGDLMKHDPTHDTRMNLDSPVPQKMISEQPMYGEIGTVNDKGSTDSGDSWSRYWQQQGGHMEDNLDFALPMLTFFERLPPMGVTTDEKAARYEFRRRGGRVLDLSPALSAGNLVICAFANKNGTPSPLPMPLTVSDEPVAGNGTTIYQFVLPLDRSAVSGSPSTQPSSQ